MLCSPYFAPSGNFCDAFSELPKNPFGLSLYTWDGGKALIILSGAPNNPGIIYTVKEVTNNARNNLPTEINFKSLSCGNLIFPNK